MGPDKSTRGHHRVADLSPTYETEEKKYAGEEKVVKENLIMEEKVASEEMKKNEEADKLDMDDEFTMMQAYMSKPESIPTIKESEVDKVEEGKDTFKDDKKSQEEYIEEIKIKESRNIEKVEHLQEDKQFENKIEEIKVEKIESKVDKVEEE